MPTPEPDTRSPQRRALDEQIAAEALIHNPSNDDAKWEQLIASPRPPAKMEAFYRKSATQPVTPLDHDRL